MSDKKIIRRQQFKFMLANLVTFIVIFSIFGTLIFSNIRNILFKEVDNELLNTKNRITIVNGQGMILPGEDILPNMMTGPRPGKANPGFISPLMMVVIWSEDGQVSGYLNLGQAYYESLFTELKLDLKSINEIKNVEIDRFTFRSLTFPMEDIFGTPYYIQLLINVEGEQRLVDNFGQILTVSITILVILSLTASYYLSKKTMKPIINAWQRQAEFVENASHELRTPLTIIQNKLEALLKTPEAKIIEKSDHIILSLSETRRLSKLTSDLLTLARADSAHTQLEKQKVKIDDFIRSITSPYIEVAESQSKHFSLNIDCDISINIDKNRIHQLLVILLDNALKYTRENDKITLNVYCDDNKVTIEVRDTGIGMSEEARKRAFDRFYREDKARSKEIQGAGLGLSIAKWIVTEHKGSINIYENQPKGTAVIVKLPK